MATVQGRQRIQRDRAQQHDPSPTGAWRKAGGLSVIELHHCPGQSRQAGKQQDKQARRQTSNTRLPGHNLGSQEAGSLVGQTARDGMHRWTRSESWAEGGASRNAAQAWGMHQSLKAFGKPPQLSERAALGRMCRDMGRRRCRMVCTRTGREDAPGFGRPRGELEKRPGRGGCGTCMNTSWRSGCDR